MIKPTVGRIILVACNLWPGEARPAIVTKVWGDTCVNATVLQDANDRELLPNRGNLTSITLYESQEAAEKSVVPDPGKGALSYTGYWMPYQIGQAAKTEAAEGKIEECIRRIAHGLGRPDVMDVIDEILKR